MNNKVNEKNVNNKLLLLKLKRKLICHKIVRDHVCKNNTDDLTGLPNRRILEHNIDYMSLLMIKSLLTKENHHSLIYCDINFLKIVNDTEGHHIGDEGIKGIVKIMKDNIRTGRNDALYDNPYHNMAARIGGDEFLIFLNNCDEDEASKVVNRIKNHINMQKEHTHSMTLAMGISSTSDLNLDNVRDLSKESLHSVFDRLVLIAEQRMYRDKDKAFQSLSEENQKIMFKQIFERFGKIMGLNPKNEENLLHIEKTALEIMGEYKKALKI